MIHGPEPRPLTRDWKLVIRSDAVYALRELIENLTLEDIEASLHEPITPLRGVILAEVFDVVLGEEGVLFGLRVEETVLGPRLVNEGFPNPVSAVGVASYPGSPRPRAPESSLELQENVLLDLSYLVAPEVGEVEGGQTFMVLEVS